MSIVCVIRCDGGCVVQMRVVLKGIRGNGRCVLEMSTGHGKPRSMLTAPVSEELLLWKKRVVNENLLSHIGLNVSALLTVYSRWCRCRASRSSAMICCCSHEIRCVDLITTLRSSKTTESNLANRSRDTMSKFRRNVPDWRQFDFYCYGLQGYASKHSFSYFSGFQRSSLAALCVDFFLAALLSCNELH